MQASTQVLIEGMGEAIVTITLNRPDKLNALSGELMRELARAFATLAEQPPRAVVMTGAGNKAFSAGVDIDELLTMTSVEAKLRADGGHVLCAAIESLPFPVIAAVGGFALGGGFELALACDFIYASDRAKFGLPEVGLGVIPGYGGTQRLARRIGIAKARELIYSGAIIDAPKALSFGIANEVVPSDDLMVRVRALAEQIAGKGPLAIAQAKRVLLRGASADLASANELEAQAFAALFGTDDQKEGMSAFVEKRKAQFRGR